MAGVAPMFSLIALVGLNFILEMASIKQYLQKVLLVIFLLAVMVYPFKQYQPPLKPSDEMQLLTNVAEWIKKNDIPLNQKVFCMYPLLGMLLNVDVFDTQKYISTCNLKHAEFSNI
jgi:hypothetical protein